MFVCAPAQPELFERFNNIGSYARQEATAESDIDVLVRAGDGDPFDVLAVAEDLHRATGKAVDVYEESELKPGAFRDAVLQEAVAL